MIVNTDNDAVVLLQRHRTTFPTSYFLPCESLHRYHLTDHRLWSSQTQRSSWKRRLALAVRPLPVPLSTSLITPLQLPHRRPHYPPNRHLVNLRHGSLPHTDQSLAPPKRLVHPPRRKNPREPHPTR